tara:strand:+ start:1276 stop:2730 length:1455 start_codon:yes stop_codon:yes gene_type:complete
LKKSKLDKLNGNLIKSFFKRAEHYADIGEHDKSIDDLTKIIELNPQHTDAYLSRGIVYLKIAIINRSHTKINNLNSNKAMEDFTKVIHLDPVNKEAYYYRGRVYGQHKYDPAKAVEDFTKAFELTSDERRKVLILLYRAKEYDRVPRRTWNNLWSPRELDIKAIDDYTKIIELDPEYANDGNGINVIHRPQFDYKPTGYIYEKYHSMGYIYELRAELYYKIGEYSSAIDDYTRYLSFHPVYEDFFSDNHFAYINRGKSFQFTGEYRKAVRDYTKIIATLDPKISDFLAGQKVDLYLFDPVDIYIYRGNAYKQLGQFKNAIHDYTTFIELFIKNNIEETFFLSDIEAKDCYYNRGLTYSELHQHEKAIDDYTKTIELDSEYTLAYYNRGIAYEKIGEYQKAINEYTKTIKLDSEYVEAYNTRSRTYRIIGDIEKAINDLSQVMILDPEDDESAKIRRDLVNQAIEQKLDFIQKKRFKRTNKDYTS